MKITCRPSCAFTSGRRPQNAPSEWNEPKALRSKFMHEDSMSAMIKLRSLEAWKSGNLEI